MYVLVIRQTARLAAATIWPPLRSSILIVLLISLTPGDFASGGEGDEATASEEALGPPPGSHRVLADDGVVRFPFDVYRGDIRFSGEINGREVRMLLDDGFMWDQLLFWGSPRLDSLGLIHDGEVTIGDSGDENAIASNTASGITISFPGVEFNDQTAVITPYSSGTSGMWWGSEGQISATLFKHFVVELNFDDMMITLTEPSEFEYRGRGVEIPWRPLGFGPWAIPATLGLHDGRTMSLNLMMDLGYNDQLQISTAGEHSITVPEQAIAGSLGINIQREAILGHFGRVRLVEIGGYEIKDVVTAFVSAESSDDLYHEVMIGLGLLSRFNLVFDYYRQRLAIEPNHRFGESFEYNMSGLSLRKGSDDCYSIVQVRDNSPGSEAGLRVGDKVTRINGQAAADFDLWHLRPLLVQEGATVVLHVLRDNEEREVSIVLRRLI